MNSNKVNLSIDLASKLFPEYPVLGMLINDPAYGYELFQRLNELNYTWHFSLTQIYNILNRLETAGYVRAMGIIQDKLPAKRYFSITSAGEDHFFSWLKNETPCSVRAIRIEFLSRVYFAQKLHLELLDEIFNQQIKLVEERVELLREQLSLLSIGQTIDRMNLDFRIRQIESTIQWLKEYQLIFSRGENTRQ